MVIAVGTLMDRRTHDQWVQLASQVLRARSVPNCSVANESLEVAAEREAQSSVSPAYRLWIADNFARDGHLTDAARAYDAAVDRSQALTSLPGSLDPTACALLHKAHALALEGSVSSAIRAFSDLGSFPCVAEFSEASRPANGPSDRPEATQGYASIRIAA